MLKKASQKAAESLSEWIRETKPIPSAITIGLRVALDEAEERGRREVQREALEQVAEILDTITKPCQELREEIHQKIMETKP